MTAAIKSDKNPDASKKRPRPLWASIGGFVYKYAVRDALVEMLDGAADVGCILLDTDSSNGDPRLATEWMRAPLEGSQRVSASLQALLTMPPISMPVEMARKYHGHSAKRVLLNTADAHPDLTAIDSNEIGRFSQSTAQQPDLEPVAAMLQRHEMAAAVLPAIYAAESKVEACIDRICEIDRAIAAHVQRASEDPSLLPLEGGWSLFRSSLR